MLANKVGLDLWKQDIGLVFVSFILVEVEEWLLFLLSLIAAELLDLSGLTIVLSSVFAVEEGVCLTAQLTAGCRSVLGGSVLVCVLAGDRRCMN